MNWNKLSKNIPAEVKIGSRVKYQVLMSKEIDKGESYGETDFQKRQIIIEAGLGPKISTITFLHEVLHAISGEHEIGLTEQQVIKFETALPYLINIIKDLNK